MRPSNKVQSTTQLRDINQTENHLPRLTPRGPKECRICLSTSDSTSNKLVSPCQCTGSMRFVHQECLSQWLQVKVLREGEGGAEGVGEEEGREVQCELCKSSIRVQLSIRRECNSCEEIKGKIGQRWVLFIVGLLGLAFSISLFVYSTLQLQMEVKRGYGNAAIGERIVVVASLGLNLFLMVFFSYTLSKYLLQGRATVKLVFT